LGASISLLISMLPNVPLANSVAVLLAPSPNLGTSWVL
jgi:hypothetical protein